MLSKLEWLKIPMNIRFLMVEEFKIPKSGFTHVEDGQVLTDGYSEKDLQTLTLEKLQSYLNNQETDYYKLLNLLTKKLEQRLNTQQEVYTEETQKTESEIINNEEVKEEKSKRGRPKKVSIL